ncbi:zinc finger protein isoform X2 [Siniperca chuatsi]|uniref:zinc finger protein isoform X2 n=1 Tax=Siniperca chuatsi TaxID=119488 RepID=UPI001CE13E50|nr:zinc finger protein isoform X2 [Siniperca chuatsi]
MKMKSAGVVDGGLFTESYCNICNAQLISESQRTAHYESKKHANKVRLFYMLHPEDGGPPSKRLRPDNPDCAETEVDRNKCCTLCNMFFTSAIVAQSHYQGKTHAKRVRLVLGEPPSLPTAMTSPTNTDSSPSTPVPTDPAACPPPSPALPWPMAVDGGNSGREAGKYCCLCRAWFNNPLMAQQHYEGKKHRRNAARARLLEQLAGSLDATESTGLRSSYSCSVCSVVLNSIEQYHAHLQGSKHQNKMSFGLCKELSGGDESTADSGRGLALTEETSMKTVLKQHQQ